MDNNNAISTINDLIETCRDGLVGFGEAADNVKNPDLKSFFNQAAAERAQCIQELEREVRRLGGDPAKAGSTAGTLHRVWMDIKGTLTGKDDHSILSEAERGEDSAVGAFRDALKSQNLPPNFLPVVQRQYTMIQQTHDRVKQMRDAKAATSRR
ncbi:MAG TPA: PA2169 family four-helix-bundle protein [Blastocatellia bacterium]|nr:PA2169 family four-helix-bundle protein [Blastocatellia bacterium]